MTTLLQQKTNNFITKAIAVHQTLYDYSKSQYINANSKIVIICSEHGEFSKLPRDHLRGEGCPRCGVAQRQKVIPQHEFEHRSMVVHQCKYQYNQPYVLTNLHSYVPITCPSHGVFYQTAISHLSGSGCGKCQQQPKYDSQYIIDAVKAIKAHKINVISIQDQFVPTDYITVQCHVHGNFTLTVKSLFNTGCKKCNQKRLNYLDELRKRNVDIGLSYPDQMLNPNSQHVVAVCKTHGELKLSFLDHYYRNSGCRYCLHNNMKQERATPFDQLNIQLRQKLPAKISVIPVDGLGQYDKRTCYCEDHGLFEKDAKHLLRGQNCPRCAISSGQQILTDYLINNNETVLVNDREVLSGFELDILLPNRKMAIEYHGLYYHSYIKPETTTERNRHQNKLKLCLSTDIRLIQIFENELILKKPLILSMINHYIGKSSARIHARSCEVRSVSDNVAKSFLDANHLMGYKASKYRIGLFYSDILMALLTIQPHTKHQYEIGRFAILIDHNIPGGFSKLLRYFEVNYKPKSLLTFADARYSTGNVYLNNGFVCHGLSRQNYYYIKNDKMLSRIKFQKHKLAAMLESFNNKLSESENMFNHGYRRIWDAGHFKFLKHY